VPSQADVVRFGQLARPDVTVAASDVDPASVAAVYFTGGTVAAAHAVHLSHTNLVAQAHQLRDWLVDARPGQETTLSVLPMFHAFGLAPTVLVTVLLAGRLALLPRFDTDLVFAAIDREQPTYLPGIPPMFRSLLASPRLQSHDLRSLRRCISIGTTLPVDAVQRFERLSGARLVEAYGLTEAAGITHAQPMEGPRQPGALLPLPGTDARIVDPRDPDRTLEVGERGELSVRGPQVAAEGWLPTGDLAVTDEDGWLAFVERKDDVVTAGLLKVVPADVERVLFELPGVEDCCVVGAAAGRRTTVVAYVVPAAGAALDEDAVRAHLADRLPAKQQPTSIEFRTELPRSVIGHARRRDLVILPPTPTRESKTSARPRARSRSGGRTGPASPDSP
jgi:long-chain acyl-CoA synthetase